MNQHDLDVLEMRIEQVGVCMWRTNCLVEILGDMILNEGYNVSKSCIPTLTSIVLTYFKRLHIGFSALEHDFAFPPSTRHNKNCKLL